MCPPERPTADVTRQRAGGGRARCPRYGQTPGLSRRTLFGVIGTALAASLAGCTAPGGYTGAAQGAAELPPASLRMEPVDDSELPTKVLYTVGIDGPDRRAELMDEVIDGGTTVERTSPPFPEDRHIYYDDAVYRLSHEVVDETPVTRYHVRVDIVQETVDESEAVPFAELPAVDREKFAAYGWDEGGTFGFGTTILYTHEERDESVLVPDSEYAYIVWADGSEAAWFVDGSHEATLNTYEYAADQVATAAEYGQRMRERMAFELAGLSDDEAAIVRTAVDEGQFTIDHERTPSPAFWSLVDRFRGQDRVHGLDEDGDDEDGPGGPYLVKYDDGIYWTVLMLNTERPPTDASS